MKTIFFGILLSVCSYPLFAQTAQETAKLFEGEWTGNWGKVIFNPPNGVKVKGTFEYCDGELWGEAKPNGVLILDWVQKKPNCAPEGKVRLKISADRNSFDGVWGHHESFTDGGTWDGQRPADKRVTFDPNEKLINVNPENVTEDVHFELTILDSKTKKPLEAAINVLQDAKTVLKDQKTPNGNFKYTAPDGKSYTFQVSKSDYFPMSERLDLRSPGDHKKVQRTIYLSPIVTGETIEMRNILFDSNKATLKPVSYPDLDRLADLMNQNSSMEIQINGHTDNLSGTAQYHMELSRLRVNAVIDYLKSKGVAANRMIAKAWGDTKPIAPNDTQENGAKNRRVEIVFTKK